jgi:hypothetical protein
MALHEITVDERRRTSLAKVGRPQDRRYLVEEFDDGTLVLTPAVTLPAVEVAALRDPKIRKALDATRKDRPALRSRGSFTES